VPICCNTSSKYLHASGRNSTSRNNNVLVIWVQSIDIKSCLMFKQHVFVFFFNFLFFLLLCFLFVLKHSHTNMMHIFQQIAVSSFSICNIQHFSFFYHSICLFLVDEVYNVNNKLSGRGKWHSGQRLSFIFNACFYKCFIKVTCFKKMFLFAS